MDKRRRAIKTRTPDTILERKVKRANLMLKNLRQAGIREGTWASRKLYDRLSGGKIDIINKRRGTIELKGKLNKTQKKVITKALENFFASETSTLKGIESVRRRTINSLRATLSDFDDMMSYDEAEAHYRMFEDKEFSYLADRFGASETWALMDDAKEQNDDETTFLTRMGTILDVEDVEVRNSLLKLYAKYVV